MTEGVVNPLEIIDIEEKHGEMMPITVRLRQSVAEQFFHEQAVRQARDDVVVGQRADARFGFPPFGDVEPAPDEFLRLTAGVSQDLHSVAHPAVFAGSHAEPVVD